MSKKDLSEMSEDEFQYYKLKYEPEPCKKEIACDFLNIKDEYYEKSDYDIYNNNNENDHLKIKHNHDKEVQKLYNLLVVSHFKLKTLNKENFNKLFTDLNMIISKTLFKNISDQEYLNLNIDLIKIKEKFLNENK